MEIIVLSTFPDYFEQMLQTSIIGRAQTKGAVQIRVMNLRDFTSDTHRTTDDRPFGGGAGMVMKIEPIHRALSSLSECSGDSHTVLTSAKGKLFTQETARKWSNLDRLILLCGHYQGVDERVAEHLIDEEIRIGDFVLTGGEPAVAVMIDAVVRLLPEVLGNPDSLHDESHDSAGIGAAPVYTRPEIYNGWDVPPVLLSGNHAQIVKWQQEQMKLIEST